MPRAGLQYVFCLAKISPPAVAVTCHQRFSSTLTAPQSSSVKVTQHHQRVSGDFPSSRSVLAETNFAEQEEGAAGATGKVTPSGWRLQQQEYHVQECNYTRCQRGRTEVQHLLQKQ